MRELLEAVDAAAAAVGVDAPTQHSLSTPLHLACSHGQVEAVKLLLEHRACVEAQQAGAAGGLSGLGSSLAGLRVMAVATRARL